MSMSSYKTTVITGLFALAFVVALCAKQTPEKLLLEQNGKRKHIIKCLEEEVISLFPSKAVDRWRKIRRKEIIKICCCRRQDHGQMIQCDSCLVWFHKDCVVTQKSVWMDNDSKWYCVNCCI